METTRYWTKSEPVGAVRLTPENIREIALETGFLYKEDVSGPYIAYGKAEIRPGLWLVEDGNYYFFNHEDFSKRYWTHSEHMAEDEKYARIYQLVRGAMNKQDIATFNGGDNVGMDFVAEETTQRILRAL